MDHAILLQKLQGYGVSGNLYNWFSDYLSGRAQHVVVEGAASLLVFLREASLLFINDLPDVIPEVTSTGLYADDTKLFQPIRTPEESKQLQPALSCTADWSKDCNLKFNSSKCKVLAVSRQKHPF